MKRALVVLALVLCSLAAFGQQSAANPDPATPEQVARLFQLLNLDAQMKSISGGMRQQMLAMVLQETKKEAPNAPPEMMAELGTAFDELFTGAFQAISGKLISDVMGPVYQKHLTRAEVDAVIAFYSSPEGSSFIKKSPAISVEAMSTLMPKLQEQMAGVNEKFKSRMQEITAKYKPAGAQ